jgi:NAD(P) transhydrogenase subunit beta
MSAYVPLLIDLSIIVLLVIGIAQFRTPRGARRGNATAALALLAAIALVLYRNAVLEPALLGAALAVGAAPAPSSPPGHHEPVPGDGAFQHGAGRRGGVRHRLRRLTRTGVSQARSGRSSASWAWSSAAGTFSGSMLASAKLAAQAQQTPTLLPGHNLVLVSLLAAAAGLCAYAASAIGLPLALALVGALVASAVLGLVFAMRIGGRTCRCSFSFLTPPRASPPRSAAWSSRTGCSSPAGRGGRHRLHPHRR